MNRRQFLSASALALAGCAERPASEPGPSARKPNIVLIVADDLGYAHLGCYGQREIRTPNIDRLAAEGLRFTDAYAGSSVCAPSRCTLMTGKHTGHCAVRGNSGGLPLPAGETTMAETLGDGGYATGLFGKWGLGEAGTEGIPSRQGFDEAFGPWHQIHAQFYWPDYLWRNEELYRVEENVGGAKGRYGPDLMLDKALDFVRRNQERPFFLYFPSLIPHHEFQAPAELVDEYKGRYREAPFIREDRGFEVQQKPAATFAAMVTRLDQHVGQIVALIDELELAQHTLILFTSDNGAAGSFAPLVEAFHGSGPLRGYKRDLYEGGIRVPLIARWPGKIEPGGETDAPVAFWDFPATAAELAGVEPPAGDDGRSFLPTLLGERQPAPEFLYWELGAGDALRQAVRMGRWKAVRNKPGAPLELYDLAADLGETNDVAADHGEIVARIEEYLAGCREDPPALEEPGWRRPEWSALGPR